MDTRLDTILGVMASSMSAESVRMNISASNLANAGAIGSSDSETYHAKHPVFATITQALSSIGQDVDEGGAGGVRVMDVVPGTKPLNSRYEPENPLADAQGRVYLTDVNPVEEMTDMISSSKQYQAAVEITNTTKKLLLQTIRAMDIEG